MEIRTSGALEQQLSDLSTALTAPEPAECVLCYVERKVRDEESDLGWPAQRPACAGAGPRSSRPCGIWRPWRRPRW